MAIEKKPSFREWLLQQSGRQDPCGRAARDIIGEEARQRATLTRINDPGLFAQYCVMHMPEGQRLTRAEVLAVLQEFAEVTAMPATKTTAQPVKERAIKLETIRNVETGEVVVRGKGLHVYVLSTRVLVRWEGLQPRSCSFTTADGVLNVVVDEMGGAGKT